MGYEIQVYRITGGSADLDDTLTTGWSSADTLGVVNVGQEGDYRFAVAAFDEAGLYSVLVWSGIVTIDLDLEPPITTIKFPAFSVNDGARIRIPGGGLITLSASDVSSGVSETLYATDVVGEMWYDGPFSLPAGEHTLTFWSYDSANNQETPQVQVVLVEPIATATAFSAPSAEGALAITNLVSLDSDLDLGAVAAWDSGSSRNWQRLDLGGALRGTLQSVTPSSTYSYRHDAAIGRSGRFAATYQTYTAASRSNVHTRAYDAVDTLLTCETKSPLWTALPLDTQTYDRRPAIDMAADGTYVLVSPWFARIVRPDAAPCDPAQSFTYSASGTNSVTDVDVAVHPDGDFVVTWSGAVTSYGTEIFAQVFDAGGNPRGNGFRVTDAYAVGDASQPVVAIDLSGAFVIAWSQDVGSLGSADVRARRFNAGGYALGPSLALTDATASAGMEDNQDPKIATDFYGNFVVTWTRLYPTHTDVLLRAVNRAGAPVNEAVTLGQVVTGNQSGAEVALSYHGNGLIAWNDAGSGTTRARRWEFTYADGPGAPTNVSLTPVFGKDPNLTLSWTDSTAGTSPAYTFVSVFGPDGLLYEAEIWAPETSFDFGVPDDGAYHAELTAIDEAGQTSDLVTSPTAVVDNGAPTLVITADYVEVVGDAIRVPEGTLIRAAATDDLSGIASLRQWVPAYNLGGEHGAPIILPLRSTPLTIEFTAVDTSGNTFTRSIAFSTFRRPQAPGNARFSPEATAGTSIGLSWDAPDDATASTTYRVAVTDDTGAPLFEAITSDTAIVVTGLGDETTLTAAIEALNAQGDASLQATAVGYVDHTPPDVAIALVPLETPLGDAPTAILDTTRVTLVASDDRSGLASVLYRVGAGPEQVFNGHFRLPVGATAQTVTYRAIDGAGNQSDDQSWSFLVSAAPVAPKLCMADPTALARLGEDFEVDGDTAWARVGQELIEFRWDEGAASWVEQAQRLPLPDSGNWLPYNFVGKFDVAGGRLVISDPADQNCTPMQPPASPICELASPTEVDRLHVYRRVADRWSWEATIAADKSALKPTGLPVGEGGLVFDGTRIVAIAPPSGTYGTLGAAFTFVFNGTSWVQEAAWQPAETAQLTTWSYGFAGFDRAPVLDGEWLYLSAQRGITFNRKLHIYHRENGTWMEKTHGFPYTEIDAGFGGHVSVGAAIYRRDWDGVTLSFTQNGFLQDLTGELAFSMPSPSVLTADRLFIGSHALDRGRGIVFEYERVGAYWDVRCVHRFPTAQAVLSGDAGSGVGWDLGVGGAFGLAGAPGENVAGRTDAGCLYQMLERPRMDYLCINEPAVADAGDDQTLTAEAGCSVTVTLDGSGSSDPDDDGFEYRWRIVAGPGVTSPIPVGDSVRPEVFLNAPGTWQIALSVVTDGIESAPDLVNVTVVDDQPPTLSGVPANLDVACDDIPTPDGVTASDNCANPTLTFTETSTYYYDDEPGMPYEITRTWVASDGARQTSATRKIVVHTPPAPGYDYSDDVEPPVAICTSPSWSFGIQSNGRSTLSASTFDDASYDACRLATRTVAPAELTCADLGTRDVTLTVGDAAGNTDSCTAAITVTENQLPTATCWSTRTLALNGGGTRALSPDDIDKGSKDVCGALADRTVTLPNVPTPAPTVTAASAAVFARNSGERSREDRRQRAYAMYRNVLYFAGAPLSDGQELYRYPGANGGLAQRVGDLYLGEDNTKSGKVFYLTVYNDKLYFAAQSSYNSGFELYFHDGYAFDMVSDFTPGTAGSKPIDLTVYNGELYMVFEGAPGGSTLVKWNSTTQTLTRFTTSPAAGEIVEILGVHDGLLYLNGRGAYNGLVTFDGTTFTKRGIPTNWNGELAWPTFFGGSLYFVAADLGTGKELWRFDGSAFTRIDARAGTTGSDPTSLVVFNGRLYFRANPGNGTRYLHWTNGTQVVNTNVTLGNSVDIAATEHALYYAPAESWRLGRYDGTTQSWVQVNSAYNYTVAPSLLFGVGAKLYFNANDGSGSITPFSLMQLVDPGPKRSFGCGDVGQSFTARLTVTDEESQTASCNSTVTIAPPDVMACQDVEVTLVGNQVALDPQQLDASQGAVVACGGTLSASPLQLGCADVGSEPIDVTLTYQNGAITQTCVSQVSVVDATPPTAKCIGASDLTVVAYDSHFAWRVGGGAVHTDTPITADVLDVGSTDNCGIVSRALTRTDTGGEAVFSAADIGTTKTLALEVGDALGSATCTVPVTVIPLAQARCHESLDLTLGADGTATVTSAQLDHGSSVSLGDLQLAVAGAETAFDCADAGSTFAVELVAASSLFPAATSSCRTNVTIKGNAAPTVIAKDVTLSLDAVGQALLTPALADGGSTPGCGPTTFTLSRSDFGCADIGAPVNVTLTGVDGTGHGDSATLTVQVVDTLPPLLDRSTIVRSLDASGHFTLVGAEVVKATDNCGDIVSYGLLPSWVTYSPPPWPSEVAVDCTRVGYGIISYSATDASGNTSTSYTGLNIVEDPPTITAHPAITVSLGARDELGAAPSVHLELSDFGASAAAACGLSSLSASKTDFSCQDVGATNVMLTAVSQSGKVATTDVAVTVEDTVPPTLIAPPPATLPTDPGVAYNASYQSWQLGGPQIDDNCGTQTPTFDREVLALGDNLITWRILDTGGKASTATQLVTVVDLEKPTFAEPAEVVTRADPGLCSASDPSLCNAFAPITWGLVPLPAYGSTEAINEAGQVISWNGLLLTANGIEQRLPGSVDIDEQGNTVGGTSIWGATQAFFSTAYENLPLGIPASVRGMPMSSNASSYALRINRAGTLIIGGARDNTTWQSAPILWTRPPGGDWSLREAALDGADPNAFWVADLDGEGRRLTGSYGNPERPFVAEIDLTHWLPLITVTPLPVPASDVPERRQQAIAFAGNDRIVGMYWPNASEVRAVTWHKSASGWEIEHDLANPSWVQQKYVHVWDASAAGVLAQLTPGLTTGSAQTVMWTPDKGFVALDLDPHMTQDWQAGSIQPLRINDRGVIAAQGTYLPWNGARSLLVKRLASYPPEAMPCDAFDNVAVATVDNDANGALPVGDNVVTWTATDTSGNETRFAQRVRVEDRETPTITAAPLVVETDPGKAYATNVDLGTPTVVDNCGDGGVNTWPYAPWQYELGDNNVTWAAQDTWGNTGWSSQKVTVVDHEPPRFNAPGDLVLAADGVSCEIDAVDLCASESDEVFYALMPIPSIDSAIGLSDVPSMLFQDGTLLTMNGTTTTTLPVTFDIDDAGIVYGATLPPQPQHQMDVRAALWGDGAVTELLTPIGSVPGVLLRAARDGSAAVGVYLDGTFALRLAIWWRASDGSWSSADAGPTTMDIVEPPGPDALLGGIDTDGRVLITEMLSDPSFGQIPNGVVLVPSERFDADGLPSVTLDRVPLSSPDGFFIAWASAGFVGRELVGLSVRMSDFAVHGIVWAREGDGYAIDSLIAPLGESTGGIWGIQPLAASTRGVIGVDMYTQAGFVWSEKTGVRDLLSQVIDPAGWRVLGPRFVNNHGWIVGQADSDFGDAFLAIPTPATCLARDNVAVADKRNDAPDTFVAGDTTVTWTITDTSGNPTTAEQIVTVLDGGAPTVLTKDAQAGLDAAGLALVVIGDVDAGSSDACSPITLSLDLTTFTCAEAGTNTVTLTATDASGNSASATTSVEVVDVLAPTVITRNAVVVLDDEGHGSIVPADVDDGSADNCGLASVAIDVTDFTCATLGARSVTLTATDGAGNTASGTATVDVRDERAPVIAACAADLVVAADAGACTRTFASADLLTGLSVTDNCGGAEALLASLKVTRSDGATDLATAFPKGTTIVTYAVTDAAGLSASCTQSVTVEDREAPVIAFDDQTVFGGCGGGTSFRPATATDNCGTPVVTMTPPSGTPLSAGSHTVVATAADGSGNTATKSATIQVIERIRIAFEPPLEDDNVADDIGADVDVLNRFKVGSTIPHKVTLYDCQHRDVTAARSDAVTVRLAVVRADATDLPTAVNDVPTLYNGVGSADGVMVYLQGHYHLNRASRDLAAGVPYRSVVWVEWKVLPGLVAGVEDALLLGR